jgi:ethanolamine utilization protein EutQ (cupin superfamily)
MSNASVSLSEHDAEHVVQFGPATMENRTTKCGLTELGTFVMAFEQDGYSDPWTVQYEETIYVITGEARLIVHGDDGKRVLTAAPDQLLVLPKDSTVQYGGSVGTRLLLSISPVDWRARLEG